MAASVVKCFIRHIQSSACLHSGLTTLPYGAEHHVLVCRLNIPLSVSTRGRDVASTPVCVVSVRHVRLSSECEMVKFANRELQLHRNMQSPRSCELLCGQFNIAKEEIAN